jgi:uncharacterized protein YbjQ (UPF0145 family)
MTRTAATTHSRASSATETSSLSAAETPAPFEEQREMSDQQQLQARAPYSISEPRFSVSPQMVTTAFELPGFRVRQNLGVVRGIVVRSRNLFVNIGAIFNSMVGGNITAWTNLCETTRRDAFDIMVQHATELGANAIIGARYDATEIAQGATEVLAYGTAVIVDPTDGAGIYGS